MRDSNEVIADPAQMYERVSSCIKQHVATRARDYFHASSVEVMCKAQHVARTGRRAFRPDSTDLSYLLTDREKVAATRT